LEIGLSILNPKARPLLGVDVGSSAVRMVELSGSPAACQLDGYAIEPLPEGALVEGGIVDIDAVSGALMRCLHRLGTSTRYVAMAMPSDAVITKKIILPAGLPEIEMELQVEAEANQYIPFAIDEVNLDFQVIGPAPSGPDEIEVLIAVSRKEGIEDRVACAETAKLKPVVMDVELYAMLAAFDHVRTQFASDTDESICALVDVGTNATKVTMMKGKQIIYGRELAFGGDHLTQSMMRTYGMSHEDAEKHKRGDLMLDNLPENFETDIQRPYLDNLAVEVSRALRFFFTSTPFGEVHHIVLMGGGSLLPGSVEAVAAHTRIHTVLANPFVKMALSQKVRPQQLLSDAPSLMVACGLAMRRFDQ